MATMAENMAKLAENMNKLGVELGAKLDTQGIYSFDVNLAELKAIGASWSRGQGVPTLISQLTDALLVHIPKYDQIHFAETRKARLGTLNHTVQDGVAATSVALQEGEEPEPAGANEGNRPSGTVLRSGTVVSKKQPNETQTRAVAASHMTPRKLGTLPNSEDRGVQLTAAISLRSYPGKAIKTKKDMSQRPVQKGLIGPVPETTKLDSQGTPALPAASDEERHLFEILQDVTNRLLLSLPEHSLGEVHHQCVFQACCNIVANLVFGDDCQRLADCRSEAHPPGLKYYLLDHDNDQPILYSGWGDLDLSFELDGLGRVSMLLVEMKRSISSSRHLSQLFGQVCSAHLHHQGSTEFDVLELKEVTSHPILGVLTNGVALLRCRYSGVDEISNQRMFTVEDLVDKHKNVYAAMYHVFQEVKLNIDQLKATFVADPVMMTVTPSASKPSLSPQVSRADEHEFKPSGRKATPFADLSNTKRPSGTVIGQVHRSYTAHWYKDLLERAGSFNV